MIIKPNEFGGLNEPLLEKFESGLKKTLPSDYRNFLLLYNGGRPKNDVFRSKLDLGKRENFFYVSYFYGIHNGEYWSNLEKKIDMYKNRMPLEFIPIGDNKGGDCYIIALDGENKGKIFFWNHNFEADEEPQPYYENIILIANSFSEFFSNLESD